MGEPIADLPTLESDGVTVRFDSFEHFVAHHASNLDRGSLVARSAPIAVGTERKLRFDIPGVKEKLVFEARVALALEGSTVFILDRLPEQKAVMRSLIDKQATNASRAPEPRANPVMRQSSGTALGLVALVKSMETGSKFDALGVAWACQPSELRPAHQARKAMIASHLQHKDPEMRRVAERGLELVESAYATLCSKEARAAYRAELVPAADRQKLAAHLLDQVSARIAAGENDRALATLDFVDEIFPSPRAKAFRARIQPSSIPPAVTVPHGIAPAVTVPMAAPTPPAIPPAVTVPMMTSQSPMAIPPAVTVPMASPTPIATPLPVTVAIATPAPTPVQTPIAALAPAPIAALAPTPVQTPLPAPPEAPTPVQTPIPSPSPVPWPFEPQSASLHDPALTPPDLPPLAARIPPAMTDGTSPTEHHPPEISLGPNRSGRIKNPTSAHEVLRLPLGKVQLAESDVDPISLPVLLLRFIARRDMTGVLDITAGGRTIHCPVLGGVAYLTQGERTELINSIRNPTGTYAWRAGRVQSNAPRVGFIGITMDLIKTLARTLPEDSIVQAFGPRMDRAPKVWEEQMDRLSRLRLVGTEARFAESAMTGTRTARELVGHGGIGQRMALGLLLGLTALDFLEWREVAAAKVESPSEQLARQAKQLETSNHFEVLGIHWSAQTDEIQLAYQKIIQLYREGGPNHQANAEATRRIRQRIEDAYAILKNEADRMKYRKVINPNVDLDSVQDILHGTVESLELRGATREAEDAKARIADIKKIPRAAVPRMIKVSSDEPAKPPGPKKP